MPALASHVQGEHAMRLVTRVGGWPVSVVLLVLAGFPADRLASQAAKPDSFRLKALAILRTVPLIDGHNDIPDAIRERGGLDAVDFSVSQPKLMTDLPRIRAGAMGGQFWAAYVPVTTMDSGPHPAVYALEQIDLVHRLCARHAGRARDEPARHAGRPVACERRDHVRRAPHLARAHHLLPFVRARSHRPRA